MRTTIDSLSHPDAGLDVVGEQRTDAEGPGAGSFLLVTPGPKDATLVALGHVAGDDAAATRLAAGVREKLASFARYTDDPLHLLSLAEAGLDGASALVTAVCVAYEPRSRRVRWASAGHPRPRSVDTGRPIGDPGDPRVALGVVDDLGGRVGELHLACGAGLLLHTVAFDATMGARLRGVLSALHGRSAGCVADGVLAAGDAAAPGRGPGCFVVLRAAEASTAPSRSEATRRRQLSAAGGPDAGALHASWT